jgi:hypothetical protein
MSRHHAISIQQSNTVYDPQLINTRPGNSFNVSGYVLLMQDGKRSSIQWYRSVCRVRVALSSNYVKTTCGIMNASFVSKLKDYSPLFDRIAHHAFHYGSNNGGGGLLTQSVGA